MAETLFRFITLRPPLAQNPDIPSIRLAQPSAFQKNLAEAGKDANPREALVKVAKAFVADKSYISDPEATPFQGKLLKFSAKLDKGSFQGTLYLKDIVRAATDEFGSSPAELVKTDEFTTLLANLRDSVIAIKYVQEEHSRPIEALVNQIRDLELLQKAATLSTDEDNPTATDVPSVEPASLEHSDSDVQPWHAQTEYKIGSQVIYAGITYICIQSHTSLEGWEPPKTPALWVRVTPPGPPESLGVDLFQYRKRPLLLPDEAALKSIISNAKDDNEPPPDAESREKQAQSLIKKHRNLSAAIDELVGVDPDHIQVLGQEPHSGTQLNDQFTAVKQGMRQLDFHQSMRDIVVGQFKPPPVAGPSDVPAAQQVAAAGDQIPVVELAQNLLTTVPRGLNPNGPFKPQGLVETTFRLKKTTPLSESTQSLLRNRGVSVQTTPLNEVVKILRDDMAVTISDLKRLTPDLEQVSLTRIGDSLVAVRTPIESQATSLLLGHNFGDITRALPALPPDGRIPHTKGKASPAGIADLLVVKQQLKGYEASDIAHIENVLRGESMNREITTTTRTESTTFEETEVTTNEENELTSTNRFEMSKESSETIKEDQALKAGLQVSAKYGPFVEVSASVEGAVSRSKEEVNKSASKFSQDITERTVKKITDRTLQRRILTTINDVVEKNSHSINNAAGTLNISGVYQWVNKLYEAQVFNYGLRTMFDFMIPEPAAFLIDAMARNADQATVLNKPLPFTVTAAQVSESNYYELVLRYQATDVVPPPADFITKTDQVFKEGGDQNKNYDHGAVISIDTGYEAVWGTITRVWNTWQSDATIDAFVGTSTHRFTDDGPWSRGTALNSQRSSISWGFNSWRISELVVSVEIYCRRTARALDAWKAETHAKLLTAYKARMQEYEEKLAALKLQAGVAIEGKNPEANLVSIKQELQKNCISILTAQHFDLFNSISSSTIGLPQINLYEAEAEGSYVRFFEQAFEWDQIMYVTYPYFWGRKQKWLQRLSFDDPDPVFDEFLKAGFCRVVIPARPGFEGAIDHFLQFGELWNGGPLPPISSPLYVPIADEIAERAQRPRGEVPQGEPWTVRIPTTLVKLRPDDKLPKWEKDDQGTWVPDE